MNKDHEGTFENGQMILPSVTNEAQTWTSVRDKRHCAVSARSNKQDAVNDGLSKPRGMQSRE
jgi:hypothetical protein